MISSKSRRLYASVHRRTTSTFSLDIETQIAESAIAVKVLDDHRHLAIADVEQGRPLGGHLSDFHSARLASPAEVRVDEDALVIEFAAFVHSVVKLFPDA